MAERRPRPQWQLRRAAKQLEEPDATAGRTAPPPKEGNTVRPVMCTDEEAAYQPGYTGHRPPQRYVAGAA